MDWVRTFVTKELMPLEPQVLGRERTATGDHARETASRQGQAAGLLRVRA